MYEKYFHEREDSVNLVAVRSDLKGKHREYCMCFDCTEFNPDTEYHCPIAKAVYNNCVEFDIVSPVWECPKFYPKATVQTHL